MFSNFNVSNRKINLLVAVLKEKNILTGYRVNFIKYLISGNYFLEPYRGDSSVATCLAKTKCYTDKEKENLWSRLVSKLIVQFTSESETHESRQYVDSELWTNPPSPGGYREADMSD